MIPAEERARKVFANIFASISKRAEWVEESRARIADAIAAAEADEREACAKVAEAMSSEQYCRDTATGLDAHRPLYRHAGEKLKQLAAAIRARGKR